MTICTAALSRAGNFRKLIAAWFLVFSIGAQAGLIQTNRTERWATNVVEVKMLTTKLITEYRTNWTQEVWNNIIDFYVTNRVTKLYTNKIPVTVVYTNFVNAYHTNLKTLHEYRTNEITRYMTNRHTIEALRTNFVQAYYTNVKTLHLTNWVTVLLFKTNWVNQPVTNIISIDLPASGKASTAAARQESGGSQDSVAGVLAMQARRTAPSTTGKPAEVQITVKSTHRPEAPVQVQQWRVESNDGSLLLFGQGPEFRRALPVGRYKVEVKARQPGTNQTLAALGTLSVSPTDVLLQQKQPAKWVSP